jgi:hypothetical protein
MENDNMPKQVVNGAMLQCSFGAAPSTLTITQVNMVNSGGVPAANIMDHTPMVNILTFGMCSSLTNPTVASATAAAMGVLTPMTCVPNTQAPWAPGSPTVKVHFMASLNDTSKCNCMWGGVISITSPGQTTEDIP